MMERPRGIKFLTVDEYFASLPFPVREKMEGLRKTIKEAAPEAEELISYNMPAYRFHGILLYIAAHKAHIGFYPGNAHLVSEFRDDLKGFETSKGTIRFPVMEKIPLSLVRIIVERRVTENMERWEAGKYKRK